MSYTLPTMTTDWEMPTLWNGLRSAVAGNPSLTNCLSFHTSAKRFFRQKTDRKSGGARFLRDAVIYWVK